MATHSSILAWRILWTQEPDGLQSMGLRKSWTKLSKHINIYVYIYIEHTQTCLTYIEYILSVLYVQIYRDLDNLNSVYSFL